MGLFEGTRQSHRGFEFACLLGHLVPIGASLENDAQCRSHETQMTLVSPTIKLKIQLGKPLLEGNKNRR